MATIKLTREELYKQVWTTPASTLATEFGISDVALAQVCRRLPSPLLLRVAGNVYQQRDQEYHGAYNRCDKASPPLVGIVPNKETKYASSGQDPGRSHHPKKHIVGIRVRVAAFCLGSRG